MPQNLKYRRKLEKDVVSKTSYWEYFSSLSFFFHITYPGPDFGGRQEYAFPPGNEQSNSVRAALHRSINIETQRDAVKKKFMMPVA